MSTHIVILLVAVVAIVAFTLAYFGSKKAQDYEKLTMHNTASSLVVASIIASTVSFASVYIALSGQVELSHQEVFVDILSILVTVLMGWNIISVVDFKNKMEKIDTLSKDFDHVIAGIMKLNMYSFPIRGDIPTLVNSCFKSLEEIVKCEDEKVNEAAIQQNMQLLYTIIENIDKVLVFKDKRRKYLYILDQIKKNEYKDDIFKKIEKSEELPLNEIAIRIEYEPTGRSVDASAANAPGSASLETTIGVITHATDTNNSNA